MLFLLLRTYFAFWTHSTWSRYASLELDRQTYSFDYAVFDEIMRSIWQSGQLYDGYDCRSQFGEHFVPLYYLLAPVYYLFPNIKTFLTLRIIASVLAALLLGAAAWKRWHDAPAVVCLIASFLLYVPLEYPLIGYFNIEIFVVPALAGMLYFADLKQWFGMLVCLLLMLMVKENYYLTAGGFLVYAVLTGKLSWRHVALGLFVLATLFVIVANWLIPSYNPFPVFPTWGDLYERWGVTTGSVIAAWLQQPGVALRQIAQNADGVFWGALLLPVAGLPLLAPELLPVWLPGILVTHLSNNPAHRDIHYFYHCEFIPLVFWGIIIAAARLRAFCRRQTWACRVPRRLMLFLLGLTIIMQMHEGQLLNRMRVKQPDMSDAVQVSHCLSIVPQSATLRCSRSLFLHVPTPWREYFAPLLLPAGPDYLLFYLTPEERDTYEGLSMLK
ncbi:MAG TPA: DUF2079 domain-containing protein, partial [bacterium]|nr:DUF2079 domain-containing protein [bacterium]